ncbi:MAG TPA: hypothetical protein DDZ51_13775 [Planctomycetaceae bacterium]|nr:hypothetical protein [Planctomycetaceae bacterium]
MNEIKARVRPELILTAHHNDHERYWIVEDPVALKYFRLRDEECFVLRSLVGGITLVDLKNRFNESFHPLKIGLSQLNRFLFHLHDLGLVVSDTCGQGDILARRNRSHWRKRMISTWANPLAIRLPGIAAAPWIDRLYPATKVLFSRPAILVWIVLVIAATALVATNFGAFQTRLPSFSDFFTPTTAIWFAVALILSKGLHELGHALVSKHLGGGCREIGVMFLAFVPTLYCDVSDVWRLTNRWHRILISMAGIFTELVLASIVTFIWWFSEPGELQTLSLHILFLCSVSTFLFNINPLVRCDGYYVLSDLAETPNLWQLSRAQWKRVVHSWFTGQSMAASPPIPPKQVIALMVYAAASTIYCWALILGILWMMFHILEPRGLALIAWGLSGIVATGYFGPSLYAVAKMIFSPVRRQNLRISRVATGMIVTAIMFVGLFLIPLPSRVAAPLAIELRDARPIFAPVTGTLTYAVTDQTKVFAGERLAELASNEVELKLVEALGDVTGYQKRLANLEKIRLTDPSVSPLIPGEQQTLADSLERLNLWQQDRDRLVLRAPIDGVVFAPTAVANENPQRAELAQWTGTPLESQNLGAMIQVGQLICMVGNPQQVRATVFISQSDVAAVRRGQKTVMRIDQLPTRLFRGSVVDVSKADTQEIPAGLMQPLGLQNQSSQTRSEIYYQATIHFDAQDTVVLQGMTGRAKIATDPRTIADRISHFFSKHFSLH